MISGEVATVHLCSFAECMYRLGNYAGDVYQVLPTECRGQ